MKKKQLITIAVIAVAAAAFASLWRLGVVELPPSVQEVGDMEQRPAEPDAHKEEKHRHMHEEHAGGRHGHEHQDVVRLSEAEIKEFDIELATASSGKLHTVISLPGEVRINQDRLVHVVPRVSGVVREVRKKLGDDVKAGEVMVVLSSRELADLRSAYLAAYERTSLARADFHRVEKLWKKKITAEKEFLRAKKELAEAKIELRAAEQKLRALGFTNSEIASLTKNGKTPFTRYEVTAPIDGTVIKKHVVMGEAVKDDSLLYVVADLSTVWVDLSVYQKDLPFVREGQEVLVSAGRGIPDAKGRISYVGPLMGEETRTAVARVVLPNPGGRWRPGLFVTGTIEVDEIPVKVLVPKTALQNVEGRTSVFVEKKKGVFTVRPVVTGRSNDLYVEIVKGLKAGERFVSKGAFTLKSQLSKSEFSEGHSH